MYNYLIDKKLFEGSFAEFYDYYEKFLDPVYEGKMNYNHAYGQFVQSMGIADKMAFIKQSMEMKSKFEKERQLFPEVKMTLKKLSENGIINCVLTDNEKSEEAVRKEVIERFKINPYIDKIFTSYDLKVKKPSQKIFEKVLEYYSVRKSDCLFIGHDKDEIEGCRIFGIKTVLYNNYLNRKIDYDYLIHHFSGIVQIANKMC